MAYRKAKSILHEISNFVPQRNREELIETRADHIISSAIYLLEMIDSTYSPEEAEQLKKRFISSIRGGDPNRFVRSIRKLKEVRD